VGADNGADNPQPDANLDSLVIVCRVGGCRSRLFGLAANSAGYWIMPA
jgi:hypothetical protein